MRERSNFTGLVVEDEWLLRLELVEELTHAGWQLREAATGEEALALLNKGEPIDFLVTDIRLPGMVDGWKVAQTFRERFPSLPVIYVSANPVNEKGIVPGSIFLGKPCNIDAAGGLRPTGPGMTLRAWGLVLTSACSVPGLPPASIMRRPRTRASANSRNVRFVPRWWRFRRANS